MIKRTIEVEVDASTWPRGATIPTSVSRCNEIADARLGIGLFDTGHAHNAPLLSPASPARFWAWLRYYLAPTIASDLRISLDFAGLDPHQKGILSDDFGVALSTQCLFDRFGGFGDIFDGRRFMVQFAHLLPKKEQAGDGESWTEQGSRFRHQGFEGQVARA